MRKGAQAAADALGVELVFQGAPDFNPVTAGAGARRRDRPTARRDPDRADRHDPAVEPLRKAHDAGIPVITVDTFIGTGMYQTGAGDADFPLSYIASDNVLGGRMAARALAEAIGGEGKVYVSNVKPGISTTDQREEGFKAEMAENFPNIEVLETQFNDNDANKAASQLQAVFARNPDLKGVFGANLFSALGAGNGVQQAGQTGNDQGRRLRRADLDRRQHQDRPRRRGDRPAPGRDRLSTASSRPIAHLTGQSIPTAIGTGFTVIDKDNVADPEVAKYIYSD